DMKAQRDKGQYSAAMERVKVLKALEGEAFKPYRDEAIAMEQYIIATRERLLTSMREQLKRADDEDATVASVNFALDACDTLIHGFEAEVAVVREAREAHEILNEILRELQLVSGLGASGLRGVRPRAPRDEAKLAEAQESAKTLMGVASSAFESGNWMQAYLFADNVAFNFHYTDTAQEAKAMRTKVLDEWKDARKRYAYCAPILRHAETEIYLGGNREKIEAMLRRVIARYPKNREADDARKLIGQLSGG
ncbi:MAG: hypothetical protein KDB07_07070, partial [Planctomycetes bacterium]|nr:hypothetical protein [Planctomycetota bacterium]